MRKLLKADFYKAFHSKLLLFTILGSILFGGFIIFSYKIIDIFVLILQNYADSMTEVPEEIQGLLGLLNNLSPIINTKMIFYSMIPFGESYGLVISVVLAVYFCSEFRNGVMRNKIISGAKRSHIYLSSMIVASCITIVTLIVFWLSSLCLSSLVFDWGSDFTIAEFGNLIGVMAITLTIYLTYTAMLVFLSMISRSTILSIVIGVFFPMVGSTIFSFLSIGITAMPKIVTNLVAIFPSFQTTLLVSQMPIKEFAIAAVIFNILWIVASILEGIHIFKKSDLK